MPAEQSGTEEQVDVVDAQDRVVGRATRSDMRARRLRHRATYILLFRSDGRLFVHRRTSTKDVFPSYYDVAVGGVVSAGESYDQAAARELFEEVGIADVALRELGRLQFEDSRSRVNGRVYSCVYDGPLTLQEDEIVAGEWLAPDAVWARIDQQPFCPDGILALQHCPDLYDRRPQTAEGAADATRN